MVQISMGKNTACTSLNWEDCWLILVHGECIQELRGIQSPDC